MGYRNESLSQYVNAYNLILSWLGRNECICSNTFMATSSASTLSIQTFLFACFSHVTGFRAMQWLQTVPKVEFL